jgi:hypothetical protein
MLVTPGSPAAELLSTTIPSEREWGGWADTNILRAAEMEQLGRAAVSPLEPDPGHALAVTK